MLGYTTRIAIVKPGVTSGRYDEDDKLDWSPDKVTVVPVDRLVSVQPTSQAEDGDRRVMLTDGWLLVTPAGVDIPLEAIDRVRLLDRGKDVEVTGDVARWPHPIRPGGVHHVEAQLTAVSG